MTSKRHKLYVRLHVISRAIDYVEAFIAEDLAERNMRERFPFNGDDGGDLELEEEEYHVRQYKSYTEEHADLLRLASLRFSEDDFSLAAGVFKFCKALPDLISVDTMDAILALLKDMRFRTEIEILSFGDNQ